MYEQILQILENHSNYHACNDNDEEDFQNIHCEEFPFVANDLIELFKLKLTLEGKENGTN